MNLIKKTTAMFGLLCSFSCISVFGMDTNQDANSHQNIRLYRNISNIMPKRTEKYALLHQQHSVVAERRKFGHLGFVNTGGIFSLLSFALAKAQKAASSEQDNDDKKLRVFIDSCREEDTDELCLMFLGMDEIAPHKTRQNNYHDMISHQWAPKYSDFSLLGVDMLQFISDRPRLLFSFPYQLSYSKELLVSPLPQPQEYEDKDNKSKLRILVSQSPFAPSSRIFDEEEFSIDSPAEKALFAANYILLSYLNDIFCTFDYDNFNVSAFLEKINDIPLHKLGQFRKMMDDLGVKKSDIPTIALAKKSQETSNILTVIKKIARSFKLSIFGGDFNDYYTRDDSDNFIEIRSNSNINVRMAISSKHPIFNQALQAFLNRVFE